jgi:hypothetical protein
VCIDLPPLNVVHVDIVRSQPTLLQVAFHLNQISKLLLPTQTTKMCLWTLQQENSFFEAKTSPLYNSLVGDLEISEEQSKRIQEKRCVCVALFFSHI